MNFVKLPFFVLHVTAASLHWFAQLLEIYVSGQRLGGERIRPLLMAGVD